MAIFISEPVKVVAAGTGNKIIDEFFGLASTNDSAISIARMKSPSGWFEPGQTPEFDEYSFVLRGYLQVETKQGVIEVHAGQAIHTFKGEWIRYSTPGKDGAEYLAICLPAFSPNTVKRDS